MVGKEGLALGDVWFVALGDIGVEVARRAGDGWGWIDPGGLTPLLAPHAL